jgi:light-regulated signal transduction histidine kinase (bacteriophytochrome)
MPDLSTRLSQSAMLVQRHAEAHPLSECEKEPIHIPGAVQPFGVLLTVARDGLLIENASENCLDHWGKPARDLIGVSLAELLSVSDAEKLGDYLSRSNLKEQNPISVVLPSGQGKSHETWELSAHDYAGMLYLEMEPPVRKEGQASAQPFHEQIRDSVQSLQRAGTLQELCECAAREVKAITGFNRVMLYRFDTDWHGEVIAEEISTGSDSYLGHRFPASDIPAQARAIFLQNWLRMIPDARYTPSRIYPGKHPVTGESLDLAQSTLRSVSPIHLAYLANMDVAASLTISLLDQGRLWGLIACHHEHPLRVDSDGRLGAQLIGQIVSSQLRIKESLEDLDYKRALKEVNASLLSYVKSEEDLTQGLVKFSPNLLDVASAPGAAAAIHYDGEWTLVGRTPTVEQIEELVTWLATQRGEESLFQTDSLSRCFPRAWEYKEVASGLLAISIPKSERNYLLWFRPEVIATVVWAGNPEKPVMQVAGQTRLHPRNSFKSWKEIVQGKAVPWKTVEVEAVQELRHAILALDLEREYKKEQTARARAERLGREKEDMVMVVSHDLRTPLNIAHISFELLRRSDLAQEPALQSYIERGQIAIHNMEQLISGILDIAKIEAGTMQLDLQPENANELVHEVVEFSLPIASEKGVELVEKHAARNCLAYCERDRILQVLSNLVGNALKFTPEGGKVTVAIKKGEGETVFKISDTGRGIPQKDLANIFDRFWQAKQTNRLGTGLGLSIAKGIVEKHGGRIWVESKEGKGSNFYFSLPVQPA